MTSDDLKEFIKEVFCNVIENMNADETIYAKYFSENYIQHVDGKTLNYNDFVAHMKVQKEVMKSVSITIKHLIVEGNKIASVHIADGIKKNNRPIKAQVNAVFVIDRDKVVLCDELTRLIIGEKSDEDIGSRH